MMGDNSMTSTEINKIEVKALQGVVIEILENPNMTMEDLLKKIKSEIDRLEKSN